MNVYFSAVLSRSNLKIASLLSLFYIATLPYSLSRAYAETPPNTVAGNFSGEVEVSPNDPKRYEALVLDNQLEVLLISDPTTDQAAASMNVAVGSSANPKDRAGLAHFLEHMLFLGTDKYPEADEYQSFIRSHGGGHNAYTSQANTNYFFDVEASHLEPALDRFAQFFIAPRFDEKYVDRERHAVHSEYQSKIKDDYRRGYAALKQAMNTEHSYNRFAVGSLETLSNTPERPIRKELIEFYNRYYSANLMSLVVLGKEPLAELKALVKAKFAAVKNVDAQAYEPSETLFKPGQLPQKLFIEPVKDIRTLTLSFPIPAFRQHWRTKPLHYISNLVGYEGQGSLLSLLKDRGWATGLSSSPGHNLENEGTFTVMIQLTEQGLEDYLQVSQTFFQFIERFKAEGLVPELYSEEKRLREIQFRFQEQSEPIHLVSGLAAQMQYYPTAQAISANYLYEQFQPELIQQYLQSITTDNLFLTLSAKGLETDRVEQHYLTPYRIAKFTQDELAALQVSEIDSALSIRQPNPFIAESLDILADNSEVKPHKLQQQLGYTLWHQQDTSFNTPKANLYFNIQSVNSNNTPKAAVLNSMFTQMIQEQLNETLYDAYLAGMGSEIYPHLRGLSVRLSGYSDKLHLLLDKVTSALAAQSFSAERFEIVKQQQFEALQNTFNDKPYNQTTGKIYELLMPQYEKQQRLDLIDSLTLQDLQDFAQSILERPNLNVLAHGNVSEDHAKQLGQNIVAKLLQPNAEVVPKIDVARLPAAKALTETLDINHTDAAISVLLQGENNSSITRGSVTLLAEILSSPFYNELRTEKQLGYIVFASPMTMNTTPNMVFIVQSPNTGADELEQNIHAFLKRWQTKLSDLSPLELKKYKLSVLSRINQKDNKLNSRTQRYWQEIDRKKFNFDSKEQHAKAVSALELQDLQAALATLMQRQLIVKTYGTKLPAPTADAQPQGTKQASEVLAASQDTVPDA